MTGRRMMLVTLLASSVAGCTSGKFEPRIVGPSISAKPNEALAQAQSYFQLGNYALASEAFRKVIRFAPDEVAAYNGLAACYDKMGRFDLSRRYYEQALAIAPDDATVMHNFSVSLQMQHRREEADAFAAASRSGAPSLPVEARPSDRAIPMPPARAEIMIELPPASAAQRGPRPELVVREPVRPRAAPPPAPVKAALPPLQATASVTIELPASKPSAPARDVAAAPSVRPEEPKGDISGSEASPVEVAAVGIGSVTIELPPALRAVKRPFADVAAVHLERRSRQEVALVTYPPGRPARIAAKSSPVPVTTRVMVVVKQDPEGREWRLIERAVAPVRQAGAIMSAAVRNGLARTGIARFFEKRTWLDAGNRIADPRAGRRAKIAANVPTWSWQDRLRAPLREFGLIGLLRRDALPAEAGDGRRSGKA